MLAFPTFAQQAVSVIIKEFNNGTSDAKIARAVSYWPPANWPPAESFNNNAIHLNMTLNNRMFLV
jgi:hypothetical protein